MGREDEPKLDKESQERVKKEQKAQHALKAQLEELVGALKQSTLMVHSSLTEQNKVCFVLNGVGLRVVCIFSIRPSCKAQTLLYAHLHMDPVCIDFDFSSPASPTHTLQTPPKLKQQVLDKTEDAAQRNLEGLQSELRKTEEQLRRSWSNSLTSCVMIVLMLGIFIATFLFMRLFPKRRWLLW